MKINAVDTNINGICFFLLHTTLLQVATIIIKNGGITMNKAIIMGRLSGEPVFSQTESGVAKCKFTVAVQESYKNKDGSRNVDFLDCVAWRSTAEFVNRFFHKGSRVAVEGKNKCDVYEKDGKKQYYKYILAESVEFAGYNRPDSDEVNDSEIDFAAEFDEIVSEESPF